MARPLRIEYPGAYYHIIQRGLERRDIFDGKNSNHQFLYYLETACIRYQIRIHAYVLMTNHYHLILETQKANLSQAMHYINGSYVSYYNAKRKRVGPLYQGRYKSILIQTDEYLHYLSRYIHLNPIRAGISEKLDKYPWSSYQYYVKSLKRPEWLNCDEVLGHFRSRLEYKKFIMEGMGQEKEFMKGILRGGMILGDDDFFNLIREKYIDGKQDDEVPLLRSFRKEPKVQDIKNAVKKEISDEKLNRKVCIYLTRKYTSLKLKEIADYYKEIKYPGISQICRRMEMARKEEAKTNRVLEKMEKILCQM